MNLLNLIEDTTTGYDNLRALMQASQSGQDAVLNVGGETITLDPMETRWMFAKYKAFNKAGRQEEFLSHLADPVKFDQHMKQLRDLIAKQKNFRGSVPGQRGVTGDVPQGVAEEAVEEIAVANPEKPTKEAAGKINWERMIKDYMGNKPFSEFEFVDDRPLTLYRSQVYAILKDFGRMKPQQKVNIILNVFGDKYATVEYIDKLRSKGMMPKKVPAYVAPGTEPVAPGQMELPGMPAPKIKEAQAQKKNSDKPEFDRTTAVNPKVARAFQLARARQSAAGSDIEAFVRDELEKGEQAQAEIEQLKQDNQTQDQQMKQLARVVSQQDQEIQQIKQQPEPVAVRPAPVEKPRPIERPAAKPEPEKQEPKTAEKPAEVPAEPKQQPTDIEQPAPVKKRKAPAKKKTTGTKTKVAKPTPVAVPPDNVVQFPPGGRRKKEPDQDELSAALQGVDIGAQGTGTYGLREDQELNIGDPVIIRGNVEHSGKTGDIAGFGRDKHFVIVDLYNFGKHAFHASNVEYNKYADRDNDLDEMQTNINTFNISRSTPGGTDKQREDFLDARDRLFRQMQNASPGEKEAIRLKITDLEGRAQAKGIKIREAGEFNRAGYNAIRDVSDWEEKMRVMRELMKDPSLMKDPEAKSAIEQRIGDLIRVGQQQGYVSEALNDKAMAVLRSLQQPAQPTPAAVDLNVPAGPRRGRPTNAERAQRHEEFLTLRRRIALLDELIKMKEQIDNLFLKAQNVRGGIYPGLQADIEMEELYPVPETDQQFQDLKDKYTKDLAALQKFLAMKKAVYREDQDRVSESTALVRLKQARQQLAQQGVVEANTDKSGNPMYRREEVFMIVHNGKEVAFYKLANMKQAYKDAEDLAKKFGGEVQVRKVMREQQELEEIDRRGFLKGMGAAAVGGAVGYGIHKDVSQDQYINPLFHRVVGRLSEYQTSPIWKNIDKEKYNNVIKWINIIKGQLLNPLMHRPMVDALYKEYQLGQKESKQDISRSSPDEMLKEFNYQYALAQQILDLSKDNKGFDRQKYEKSFSEQDVAEAQTDYQRRRQRERDVDAGKPVKPLPKNAKTDYQKKREQDRKDMELGEQQMCPECGGPSFSDLILAEKQDACYHKVRSRYKVWPSAYASGALVQCRKKGAANWGTGGKKK